jgi:hypothetical protein
VPRNCARSARPSLSKSAAIGLSPHTPQSNQVYQVSSWLRMYQRVYVVPPTDGGLTTASCALPSPSKSMGTGVSPSVPHWTDRVDPSHDRMYHVPFDGRNTISSARESPDTSAGTGMSPSIPHEIAAEVFVAENQMYQVPLDGRYTV